MKKETFLKKLKKKLEILDETEVNDILTEYEGYIDEKIEAGSTEEEAVASFGDIDELSSELLKAYKVKVHEEDPIGHFANKAINILDNIVTDLSKKTPHEILRFIIEIIFILLIISLFHIPVAMLVQLGKDVFYILSSPLNRIFYTIWHFVLEFAYFIIAILAFAKVFERRYLQKIDFKPETEKRNTQVKSKQKKEIPEKNNNSTGTLSRISEIIIKIGVFFLKFMAICILFGISFYLVGMAIVLVLCVYLLIQGVTYFGLYLVMISLFLLGVIFFWVLFNFVLDRKNNAIRFMVSIFISFLLLGVGCGFATIEIADTEFINGPPNDFQTEILREELSMEEDTVFIANISDYKIDNTIDNVIIEYQYYPLGNRMAPKIKKRNNFVYLDWTLDNFHLRSELLHHIIQDLKVKKVYNYYIEPTITIITNEKNMNLIKKNRQEYYKYGNNHYSSCEFVRTYYVEMIKDSQIGKYKSVVLSQYQNDDLVTVRLKDNLANSLEEGYFYEFTFKTYQSYIDTDIENIFSENEVISIKKTDKIGSEQKQDTTCTIFY